MKLSKAERAALKQKYDGRCAYCGCELGDRWHADHVQPVTRLSEWVDDRTPERSGYFKQTGTLRKPEFDCLENMNPACVPCNMDKGGYYLEQWRDRLTSTINTLTRDAPAYRFAKRFGLVVETGASVVFYFEQHADVDVTDYSSLSRDELVVEIERLKALLDGRFKDARLLSAAPDGKGAFVLDIQTGLSGIMAENMLALLQAEDAPNFVQVEAVHPVAGPLTFSIEKRLGRCAAAQLAEAKARIAELEATT